MVIQDRAGPSEAKVFPHAPPQGMCENLVNALTPLANQQKDGDCPVNVVVRGYIVKSRLSVNPDRKWCLIEFISVGRVLSLDIVRVGCCHVMRVRRAATLVRHLFSVSLHTIMLCDTFSHVFSVKAFSRSRMLKKHCHFTW